MQYLLLPFLLRDGFFAALVGNVIVAVAASAYFYITFRGFLSLIFLRRAEVFLYPVGIIILLFIVFSFFGISMASSFVHQFAL